MNVQQKRVDLNAYIRDMSYEIVTQGDHKRIALSFYNLYYGTITAIKLGITAKDSFGENIVFPEGDVFEVKCVNVSIMCGEKYSFSVEVGNYDVKQVNIKIRQIVFCNGQIVSPREEHIVEYEIEKLSSSWLSDNHFEHDALEIMQKYVSNSICFPKILSDGWVCCCGMLNKNNNQDCIGCGSKKEYVFEKCSEENIKKEVLILNEKKEKDELERRKAEESAREESEKRAKIRKKASTSVIAVVIITFIAIGIFNNVKYGLSKEENRLHTIAQRNYRNIDYFVLQLRNNYSDIANKYYDNDLSRSENKLSEAEKNKDYLYSRGILEASGLLYELIEEQYPEKYHNIYDNLILLHKGDIFNDVAILETQRVKNERASKMLDRSTGINEEIEKLEKYMNKTVLNPSKVKYNMPSMPKENYDEVYGISLGIMFYEDGSMMYIGEMSNGVPDGYGQAFYSSDDNNDTMANGIFENGIFVSGNHYGTDGNTNDISEVQSFSFDGNYKMVLGLTNCESSESIANKNISDDERDMQKASECVKEYVNLICEKENGVDSIQWVTTPNISATGGYYFYSCFATNSDGSKRDGTIVIIKNEDGTFSPVRLDFE